MSQPSDPSLNAYEDRLKENSTVTAILRRLATFVDPVADLPLTDPMDLINAVYSRVSLAHNIAEVEKGTSWDYCKQAALDWLRKERRWIPIHHDAFWYQMGCVPPHFQRDYMTMTGEEYTRCYHLTLLDRGPGGYWCCLLKKSQVVDPAFIATIPFADIPMLGVPESEGKEDT